MGYACYQIGNRFCGYGVPSYCEHPDCNEEIDRGMAYACGGEPYSEVGCDMYFCHKHLQYTGFKRDGSDERCDHEDDCECEFFNVCLPCSTGKPSFPYKPEHPDWIKHVLKDKTWSDWRKENPETVKEFKIQIKK